MIIDSVFQEFIKVVQENRNYTIGLVNGDGKVTACSDENLIGSVQNVDAPDSNNLFYRIRVKNVDYGWLWLYGKDENLEIVGYFFIPSHLNRHCKDEHLLRAS